MSEKVTVEIPSIYEYLNMVDVVCNEIVKGMGFSRSQRNAISISVIEACTNAMEHGNKCCPEEAVRTVFIKRGDRLVVEVYDEGKGFDYRSYLKHIPDPADVSKKRGRGIYIMKDLMDTLQFEMMDSRGMKVTLEKVLQPENN
jgi:serine/threonine-protein kinase RsbW